MVKQFDGVLDAISIHALLAESDVEKALHNSEPCTFLSTLSLRRATWYVCSIAHTARFLSTLSLRRATRKSQSSRAGVRISIHALLAESDYQRSGY